MKKIYALFTSLCMSCVVFAQQPFTEGNLVAYRVGDGTTVFAKTASAISLDEFSIQADGSLQLVQTITMPIEENGANKRVTISATKHLEGAMTRSEDGRYLVVPGYNAAVGSDYLVAERVAALVDYQGNVNSSTTLPATCLNSSFRGAASQNGTGIYFSGSGVKGKEAIDGPLFYVSTGATEGVALLNDSLSSAMRDVRIIDGQLAINSDVKWFTVGKGLPMVGTQEKQDMIASNATCYKGFYDIYVANLAEGKVAYVASTGKKGLRGIFKCSLVDGAWVFNGKSEESTDCHGLEGKVEKGVVTLYITRGNGKAASGSIATLTDDSGYNNGTFEGCKIKEVFATPAGQSFRAIAWSPVKNAIVGIQKEQADGCKIYANKGSIYVESMINTKVEISTVLGVMIRSLNVDRGLNVIDNLPNGQIYIVKVGEKVSKIYL